MRAFFGVLGLVVALALVAVLVKNQLVTSPAAPAPSVQPSPASASADTAEPIAIPPIAPGATPEQQSAQIQEQVRKAMEATMQQPRSAAQDK